MRSLFCLALGPAKWWREQCLLRGMSWHDKLLPRRMLNASVDHLSCPALPWRSLGIFLSRSRGRSNEPINQSINLCFPWDFRVVFGRIKERMKTSINQSINPSIHPSIHLSIHPSKSINQSINQSIPGMCNPWDTRVLFGNSLVDTGSRRGCTSGSSCSGTWYSTPRFMADS